MRKFILKCREYTLSPKKHPEKKDFSHLWYALILPIYLIGFFTAEALITDNYWVSYLKIDDFIPFCEWFIIPYYMWYPFMGIMGFYLLFTNGRDFKKYMTFIGLSFMTSIAVFFVFPTGQNLRPAVFPRDNILTRLIAGLYKADTNTNVLPSIHVVGSLAVPLAAQNNEKLSKPKILIPLYLTAFLICISTVFIKQHSVLDGLVAIPYTLLFYVLVYKIIYKRK